MSPSEVSALAIRFRDLPVPGPFALPVPATPPPPDDPPDVLPLRFDRTEAKLYRNRMWQRSPRCRYCGESIPKPTAGTLDHIQPKSRGGIESPANLTLSCEVCNRAKRDRTPEEWARDILFGAAAREGGAA